jgi:hypothetical protein
MRFLTLAKDWHVHRAGDRLHVLGPGEEHPGGELPAVDHARAATLVGLGFGELGDPALAEAVTAQDAPGSVITTEPPLRTAPDHDRAEEASPAEPARRPEPAWRLVAEPGLHPEEGE